MRGLHQRRRTNSAFRLLVVAGIGGMAAVTTGCSSVSLTPSLDDELHADLTHMVESARNDLWSYRDSLATDPEGTLPQIGSVSDARPLYEDPTAVLKGGVYTLLGVSSSHEGAALTLATSADAHSGGGVLSVAECRGVLRFTVPRRGARGPRRPVRVHRRPRTWAHRCGRLCTPRRPHLSARTRRPPHRNRG